MKKGKKQRNHFIKKNEEKTGREPEEPEKDVFRN